MNEFTVPVDIHDSKYWELVEQGFLREAEEYAEREQ